MLLSVSALSALRFGLLLFAGFTTVNAAFAAVPPATASPSPLPSTAPPVPRPAASESARPSVSPTSVPVPPVALPTQPPIIVEPPSVGLAPASTVTLHAQSVLGLITATLADPTVADVAVNQIDRTIALTGKRVGATTLTVRDQRGMTRDVPVRVANPAGTIAETATLRITGDPATPYFIREEALNAAIGAAHALPGAQVVASLDTVNVAQPLSIDDVTTVDVPLILQGEGDLTVQGVTHVRVENVALPPIHPSYLMVSDFPETLTENGSLFEADLSAAQAARFLYYHDNAANQPERRIVLRLRNGSPEPADIQFISGTGGPSVNEMHVGHISTQRFLVRNDNNEGTIVTIPPRTTSVLLEQPLPTRNVASGLLQIREIQGGPLHLTLAAQNASDPLDAAANGGALLTSKVRHARGIYPIPEFFFNYQYDTNGANLDIPIGQIPVPELKQGEALGGDYGVLQSITVRIVNDDLRQPAYIALYANPRGGRATGSFIIDDELVQAHALPPFGHIKLREYTVPPGGFIRTSITTMPEGGSSYPVHLIFAPDDGGTSPGAPNSLVY